MNYDPSLPLHLAVELSPCNSLGLLIQINSEDLWVKEFVQPDLDGGELLSVLRFCLWGGFKRLF